MTFREYIEARIQDEEEFDLIVGDVDMLATICIDSDMTFPTPRMTEKYGALLNAEVEVLATGVVEVFHESDKLGERFCLDMAGYCSEEEYTKLTGLE